MSSIAGAPNLDDLANAGLVQPEEAAIVAELKAGSEDAFGWLIAHYSQLVYSLVYRVLDDSSDASDTTQEVFIKVFRGIQGFNANSSLKTWIYRIALHEALNQRRWWHRHRGKETSLEPAADAHEEHSPFALRQLLADTRKSPLENVFDMELRERVEAEIKAVAEPYRTALILRDIEELSYEEIAEVTETSLGTVKSRLMRGREALRTRLERHLPSFGVSIEDVHKKRNRVESLNGRQQAEVIP